MRSRCRRCRELSIDARIAEGEASFGCDLACLGITEIADLGDDDGIVLAPQVLARE